MMATSNTIATQQATATTMDSFEASDMTHLLYLYSYSLLCCCNHGQ